MRSLVVQAKEETCIALKVRKIESNSGGQLLPHHLEQLRASGISDEVIAERGYESVTESEKLKALQFPWYQAKVPALLIPLFPVGNNPNSADFVSRPDNPRPGEKGKPIKYETPADFEVPIDCPPRCKQDLLDPAIPLFVTEGIKKADSAASRGLCCVSLLGVWQFRNHDWDEIELRRRKVYIAFDSDSLENPHVHDAAKKLTNLLRGLGATVIRLYIPSGPNGEKVGLDDYFAKGGKPEELVTFTTRFRSGKLKIRADLPTIESHEERLEEMVDASIQALVDQNHPPYLFVYGSRLSRLKRCEVNGVLLPQIEDATKDIIIDRLSQSVNYVSVSSNGRRIVNPPDIVARMITARPELPGIPTIKGIATSPFFSKQGKLISEPGYDPESGVYLFIRDGLKLPKLDTSPEGVQRARETIEDLICDFPFEDESSRSHAVAFLISPFVREMIIGPTPMFLFNAPKPGSGKTLLMTTLARVFVGDGVAFTSAPQFEEEWRKRLTSLFKEGVTHGLFDNLARFGSEALNTALTAPDCIWKDRLLGRNETPHLPIRCVWGATANNFEGTEEELRRCLNIRINPNEENPSQRRGFKHSDLKAFSEQNRPQILASVVTLVQAWIDAGRPEYSEAEPLMGSFENFCRLIGGILEFAGYTGFLSNREEFLAQSDIETEQNKSFIQAWFENHGKAMVRARDLEHLACNNFPELDALPGNVARVQLGRLLGKLRDQVILGKRICRKQSDDGFRYWLAEATKPGKRVATGFIGEDDKN